VGSGWQFYLTLILVYLGVDIIACLGLNIQLGLAGVMDFAFIIFQAVGAYVYAIFTLGSASGALGLSAGGQSYLWGTSLPFPLPYLLATAAGMILAFLCAVVVLPRLRGDYEAMAFLVISLIVSGIATNQVGLVNGANGLSGIPQPLSGVLNLSVLGYDWFYVGLTAVICLLAWLVTRRITASPMGRLLRAVRENEQAARALGKDATRARMFAFLVGGGLGGLSRSSTSRRSSSADSGATSACSSGSSWSRSCSGSWCASSRRTGRPAGSRRLSSWPTAC
jgi:ABC-type branched-subunit amino acid transport system permease subunit